MLTKTKIEYCDYTFNPVTGCLNSCPYCYARKQADRFKGKGDLRESGDGFLMSDDRIESWSGAGRGPIIKRDGCYEIKYPLTRGELPKPFEPYNGIYTPYPFSFAPTFHRYRLDEPTKLKKPSTIFVCSMADLFGDWVPDEWILEVFKVCKAAPQHRYLFLTKNKDRYSFFNGVMDYAPKNVWLGSTVTDTSLGYMTGTDKNYFLSIEPLLQDIGNKININKNYLKWVIIGAETGNRKGKIIPKREWIENIVEKCRASDVPVFMKNSLAEIWGEPLIQEYPWKE
jgi:protein gp37